MQDRQGHHASPFVADAAACFITATVSGKRELGNTTLVVAGQAGASPLHWVQDGRRRCRGMTDLADVVGAPFVIGRDGLLARHPMAGATVLATGHRVGDGGGPGYQRVCRLGPANWGVTQGTIVVAKSWGRWWQSLHT